MNDGTSLMIEDCMVLVLAIKCETCPAAFARTMVMRRTEVPATRPLQQVSPQCRHMSDLRTRRRAGSFSKRSVALANDRVLGESSQRHQRPYAKRAVFLLNNFIESRGAAQIHEPMRSHQAPFHEIEKVEPASLEHDSALHQGLSGPPNHRIGNSRLHCFCGLLHRLRIHPFEAVHGTNPYREHGRGRRGWTLVS